MLAASMKIALQKHAACVALWTPAYLFDQIGSIDSLPNIETMCDQVATACANGDNFDNSDFKPALLAFKSICDNKFIEYYDGLS